MGRISATISDRRGLLVRLRGGLRRRVSQTVLTEVEEDLLGCTAPAAVRQTQSRSMSMKQENSFTVSCVGTCTVCRKGGMEKAQKRRKRFVQSAAAASEEGQHRSRVRCSLSCGGYCPLLSWIFSVHVSFDLSPYLTSYILSIRHLFSRPARCCCYVILLFRFFHVRYDMIGLLQTHRPLNRTFEIDVRSGLAPHKHNRSPRVVAPLLSVCACVYCVRRSVWRNGKQMQQPDRHPLGSQK